MTELDRLLVSKSGWAVGRLKSIIFALSGLYLIAITAWRYISRGVSDGAQYTLLVGALSFIVIRYRKLVYVSNVGVVRETRTWRTAHREILPWNEVQFISIIFRGNEAMVFMERDSMGWKVLFGRDQVPALLDIFAKYIPDVEIDTEEIKR